MEIAIRPARRNDALHVAALIDIAGHGIEMDVWTAAAGTDGSPLSSARSMVIQGTELPYHYSRAEMIEANGEVAGGLIGGLVTPDQTISSIFPPYLAPLLELENLAVGYWAIIGLAVYPDFRGRGLASRLLMHADGLGRAIGATGLSLVVEDTNSPALNLYRQWGFGERDRRPWLAYGGRSGPQNWLMMTRPLSGDA